MAAMREYGNPDDLNLRQRTARLTLHSKFRRMLEKFDGADAESTT